MKGTISSVPTKNQDTIKKETNGPGRKLTASRSLSETEHRYTQIEMLAVECGLEKFHYYTHGRKVPKITNHKPLVSNY